MTWTDKRYVARTMSGEAIGIFTITLPDAYTLTLDCAIQNSGGSVADLNYSEIISDPEFETLQEFEMPVLEVVKEVSDSMSSTYHVLLRRSKSE